MTNAEKTILKQNAREAMKENGIKVFQKDMILLECDYKYEEFYGFKKMIVGYVMFEDRRTGKEWQCYYGHYNVEKDTLWSVREFIA